MFIDGVPARRLFGGSLFGVLGEGASPSVVLCGAIPQRTSEASVRDEADFHNLENLLPSIDCRK